VDYVPDEGKQGRGGPLPSIDVADALLDERRELAKLGSLTPNSSEKYR
jgi:hypothetical protein